MKSLCVVITIRMTQSGHETGHVTTAQLSWHVQIYDLIRWLFFKSEPYDYFCFTIFGLWAFEVLAKWISDSYVTYPWNSTPGPCIDVAGFMDRTSGSWRERPVLRATARRIGFPRPWSDISHHEANYSYMVTSSNGNIFRITGPLWGESTGHWWITKASNAELWYFLWSAPKQTVK